MTKMELFERIRIDHEIRGMSIRAIARDEHVHRRMVRQAIEDPVPPARKQVERKKPKLGPFVPLIKQWLIEDQDRPRKQRHTARRVWQRLAKEHACTAAESSVRRLVGQIKREMGSGGREVFVPQEYSPGEEAEVDFYEAEVMFPDGPRQVHVFVMRACFSGREFHKAFLSPDQDSFVLGHLEAFEFFGGCFTTIRYDNLSAAVKKVLRGRRRKETDRFVALRSHYLFEAVFCRPGKAGAHEKGGVEGGCGRFRRKNFVPVPEAGDMASLNGALHGACVENDLRTIEGRSRPIAEAWELETPLLRALPDVRFDVARVSQNRVDSKSRVKVGGNHYSVPVALAHLRVEVRIDALRVHVFRAGRCIADHERLAGRGGMRLELDHYLDLLRTKPAALRRSVALGQARRADRWPPVLDRLWKALVEKHGQQDGTRELVEALMALRGRSSAEVQVAAEQALALGCLSADALVCLVSQEAAAHQTAPHLSESELGELTSYHHGDPSMAAYEPLSPHAGAA